VKRALYAPHVFGQSDRGHANCTMSPRLSAAMKQAGYSCTSTGAVTPLTTEVQEYRGRLKLLDSSAFHAHVALMGGAEVLQERTPVCWLNSGVAVLHSIIGKKKVSISLCGSFVRPIEETNIRPSVL